MVDIEEVPSDEENTNNQDGGKTNKKHPVWDADEEEVVTGKALSNSETNSLDNSFVVGTLPNSVQTSSSGPVPVQLVEDEKPVEDEEE